MHPGSIIYIDHELTQDEIGAIARPWRLPRLVTRFAEALAEHAPDLDPITRQRVAAIAADAQEAHDEQLRQLHVRFSREVQG